MIKKISEEKETIAKKLNAYLEKAQPIHKGDKTALLGIKVPGLDSLNKFPPQDIFFSPFHLRW